MKTELHFTIIKKENQSTLIQVFNKTPPPKKKARCTNTIEQGPNESSPRCPVNVINLLLQ